MMSERIFKHLDSRRYMTYNKYRKQFAYHPVQIGAEFTSDVMSKKHYACNCFKKESNR